MLNIPLILFLPEPPIIVKEGDLSLWSILLVLRRNFDPFLEWKHFTLISFIQWISNYHKTEENHHTFGQLNKPCMYYWLGLTIYCYIDDGQKGILTYVQLSFRRKGSQEYCSFFINICMVAAGSLVFRSAQVLRQNRISHELVSKHFSV